MLVVHPVWSLLCLSVSMLLLLLMFSVPVAMMPTPTSTLLYFFVFHIAASPSDTLVVRITKLEWPARFVPQVRHRWYKRRPGDFRISSQICLPPVV